MTANIIESIHSFRVSSVGSLRGLQKFAVIGFLALGMACTKAKKADDSASSEGLADSSTEAAISDRDIGFDAQGSDSGRIDGLNTVYFEFDQARLSAEAKRTLAGNADWMRANPGMSVQIEGHTDSRGSNEYNLALGERRAKVVKQYLQGLGIESKRLPIISYGEEKPMVNEESESAWGRNRRANFVPLK